jgi:acetylglutamate kinase
MELLRVFKIGGKIVEDAKGLQIFLEGFAHVPGKKVLIHGGGKWVSEMSRKLGNEVNMVDGRRITDADTLEVVKMMLAGVANKNVVSLLQEYGCNAIGLTGADGNSISANRRPVVNGIDYGFVGDVEAVSARLISQLLNIGLTPVFTAMTHDGHGSMLNTNADTIASAIATAMVADYRVKLVYFFELNGVLRDLDDLESVIEKIDSSSYLKLKKDLLINKGMIPKIDNAFDALNKGVQSVKICNSNQITYFSDNEINFGTTIIL